MFILIGKDLIHHRRQALFSLLGLAVVVFSYLILVALAQSIDRQVKENHLNRNLLVIQSDAIDPNDADVAPEVQQWVEGLQPELLSRVVPVIYRMMRVDGSVVQMRAVPLEDWQPAGHLQLVAGQWPIPPDEAAIGEGAALAHGWQVGSLLTLYGREFRVSGIFRAPGITFASIWLPLEVAQDMFTPRRTSQLLILQVAAGMDAEDVRQRLQNDPHLAGRYAVYFEENYTRRNTQALEDIILLMRVVSNVALLAVTFGVYNATSLSVVERMREIGILRAVGFGPGAVLGFLLVRALLLGLLAYVAGLSAAWAYAAWRAATQPLFVLGWPMEYGINLTNALGALVWMCLLTPLGAWLAARPLRGMSVADVLRRPV